MTLLLVLTEPGSVSYWLLGVVVGEGLGSISMATVGECRRSGTHGIQRGKAGDALL